MTITNYDEAVAWLCVEIDAYKDVDLYSHARHLEQVLAVLQREHEEAERLRWLCKDGAERKWTFWLGRNQRQTRLRRHP